MSLPALPNLTILVPEQAVVWGYTLAQLEADRKECRRATLVEMIALCDSLADGWGDVAEESGMCTVKNAIEELL